MAESPHRTSPIDTVARLLDSGDLTLDQLQRLLDYRRGIEEILAEAGQHEIIIENMLRYKAQFEALSEEAKNGFTWEELVNASVNKKKFKLASTMQGGGQIWFVRKKGLFIMTGELLFKDFGSEPVRYLKNKETGEMTVIYDRNEDQMRSAEEQIAQKVAEWANYREMAEAVKKAGLKLFAANPNETISDDMNWAAKVNGNRLFVGSLNKAQLRSSILQNIKMVQFKPDPRFKPDLGYFDLSNLNPDYRYVDHGVVRWL